MNSYIEICKQKLNAIVEGSDSFSVHKEYILTSIQNRVQEADYIIVCGLSPLGRRCREYVGQSTKAKVSVFDIREEQYINIPICKGKKNLYIICSREDAQKY